MNAQRPPHPEAAAAARRRPRAAASAAVPRVALAVLLCALAAPREAAAVGVTWGHPFTSGTYTTMTIQIENDNPGTSYTSATIDSLMHLIQVCGIDPTGMTGDKKNIGLTVNDGSGYVNEGWGIGIDATGRISIWHDASNPFADPFNFGDIFFLTVGINNAYLATLGWAPESIVLGPNTAGATDTALTQGGSLIPTQPASIPLLRASLALGAPVVSRAGAANACELSVWSVGLTFFRLEAGEAAGAAPSGLAWSPGTFAATGRVTRVVDTNTAPARLYRAVAP